MPCGMPAVATEIFGHINEQSILSVDVVLVKASSVPEK